MTRNRSIVASLVTLLTSSAFAQQGVLTNGNSVLPSCAQGCTLLQQAAQACGGTTTEDQTIWNCFCHSGYLVNLYSSDTNICSTVCTDPSDNTQVTTWYRSNCGTDFGASEHPDTTPVTSGVPGTATTTTSVPGTSSTSIASSSGSNAGQSWFDTHWRWVVMIIVLAIGLSALAAIFIFLKKRHRRKRDQINGGFNAGITTRQAPAGPAPPPVVTTHANASFASGDHSMTGAEGATNSARTRDSYMPYGNGYTRSESRLGYQADRGSSVPRGSSPLGDVEKQSIDSRVQTPEGRNYSRASQRLSRPSWRSSGLSEKVPQEDDNEGQR